MNALTPRWAVAIATIAATWAPTLAHAAPSDAKECARAAEQVLALRKRGKLVDATAQLPACLRASCPSFVRDDCAQAQNDLTASVPTVVVSAKLDDGSDLAAVRVVVDGDLFLDRLDGLAKPIDPGEHDFRFETDGAPSVTQHVVLREGEKRRTILVVFAGGSARQDAASSTAPARSVSPFVWVVGGVAIVGLAGFAYFGATGLSDVRALRDGCGRDGSCATADVHAARTKLWIGDALFAVGVTSIGAATWFFLRSPNDTAPTARIGVRAAPGGGMAEFRASF